MRPASRGNGLAMRAGLFLQGLSTSFDVHVVVVPFPPSAPDDPADPVPRLAASIGTLELEERPLNARERLYQAITGAAGLRRANDLRLRPEFHLQLTAASSERVAALAEQSDLVHVMRMSLVKSVDFLFGASRLPPMTLDLDDLDSEAYRGMGDIKSASRLERWERAYLDRFDRVYVASARDPEIIARRYPNTKVVCVPNCARGPSSERAGEPLAEHHDLLFVGSLNYGPNIDAVRWLCLDMLPRMDNVSLAIVGSNPAPEVWDLAGRPGVKVIADVPDVSPWYAACRVAVVPLRLGGGTPTKVAEAAAHGRPVVATSFAVSGLPPGVGGFVVADTPDEFAEACRRLLDDPEAARDLAAVGTATYVSAERAAAQIDSLTREVVAGG